jgi:perosamine synthetase
MSMKIPLFKTYSDENDIKAVNDVIRFGMQWCIGPQVAEFEKKICEYSGSKHCVTFNSGGSALHALMLAHGIGPGDEIIVPSFTFIATAYAPMYVGAKPVFADIEEKTLGLDPESVKKKITKKTKAILPIHYGGIPCKIEELKEIAEEKGIALIEDAAEAFGAKVGKKFVGTLGDSAIFSFCQNKIFSTGEGGCAVTDDDGLYEKLKLIASYGRVCSGDYFNGASSIDYVSLGYNWRISSIAAALGISQIEKVDKPIKMRIANAEYFNRALGKIDGVKTLEPAKGDKAVYQLYTIMLRDRKTRDGLSKFLAKKGISSKVYFDPVHEYSIFKNSGGRKVRLPVTENVSSRALTLPMYPHMTKDEKEYIVDSVKGFFEERE